jgi:flagellar motor switch/type III secretory pathway protein FliN
MSSSPTSSFSSEVPSRLAWLMDVSCPVESILGTATITVADCARLEVGSVVRLRQSAGGDLEIRVSGIPFAAGEVVVADDTVSMRLGRVLPPSPEGRA